MNKEKINKHFIKIVDEIKKENNIKTDKEFSSRTGINAGIISGIRKNNPSRNVTLEMVYDTCEEFDLSSDDFLFFDRNLSKMGREIYRPKSVISNFSENESRYSTFGTKKLKSFKDDISKNKGIVPIYKLSQNESFKDLLIDESPTPTGFFAGTDIPACEGAIRVFGDHMAPRINKGDVIIFKQITHIPKDIFWGEIYLISIGNEEEELLTLRYIHQSEDPDSVLLVSHNERYPKQLMPIAKIKAIAIVKGSYNLNTTS